MGGSDAVVLGGDLNTEPADIAYRIIRGIAGLEDACSINSSNLGTNECANNSYTSKKLARKEPEGKRIDHILYLGSRNLKVREFSFFLSRFGKTFDFHFLNQQVEVTSFKHPFPARVPDKDFSYSDHEAIMATLKLKKGEIRF